MNGIPILSLVTFVPLAGAIVLGLLPARYARPIALVTALVAWVLSLVAAASFAAGATGFQF
jgi:NADH:ubiquinone oxidoreductase subunit 4 (subunit M)